MVPSTLFMLKLPIPTNLRERGCDNRARKSVVGWSSIATMREGRLMSEDHRKSG